MIFFNQSCNCKVYLSVHDIVNICFKPLLKNITTIAMSSLTNNDLFGRYMFIDYFFSLIHFNRNSQFQKIITQILDEEADYFNPEHGIETFYMVLQELPSQFSHPIPNLQPFCYKGFIKGTLHHIYSQDIGFAISVNQRSTDEDYFYKNKRTDIGNVKISENIAFPLFKKECVLSNTELKHSFYLCSSTTLQNTIDIGN